MDCKISRIAFWRLLQNINDNVGWQPSFHDVLLLGDDHNFAMAF